MATDVFACQKYGSNAQDNAGNLLGGVSATITIYGSASLATIYSDSLCQSTIANPLTSMTDGSYTFYADDGHYTIALSLSGYVFSTVEDVTIVEPIGANIKMVSEFPTPDDICAASGGAIVATSSTVRTIWVNAAVACTVTTSAPSNISWIFVGKGSVSVSSTKTLTINGPVNNFTDHAVWIGSGTTVFGAGAGPNPYGKNVIGPNLTYGPTMTADSSTGDTFYIVPTNGTAWDVSTVTRPAVNRNLTFIVVNSTGGALGAGTFTCCKAAAWTQPANGFNRTITFRYTGTVWQEMNRTTADIPN
jgi:hypothetical protein